MNRQLSRVAYAVPLLAVVVVAVGALVVRDTKETRAQVSAGQGQAVAPTGVDWLLPEGQGIEMTAEPGSAKPKNVIPKVGVDVPTPPEPSAQADAVAEDLRRAASLGSDSPAHALESSVDGRSIYEVKFRVGSGSLTIYQETLTEKLPVEALANGKKHTVEVLPNGLEVVTIESDDASTTQVIVVADDGTLTNFISEAPEAKTTAPLSGSELRTIALRFVDANARN